MSSWSTSSSSSSSSHGLLLGYFLVLLWIVQSFFARAAPEFLVRLRHPTTLKSLMESTVVLPKESLEAFSESSTAINHFKSLHNLIKHNNLNITHKYSFGGFEAFSANLTQDLIKKLKENPYIAEVVCNDIFQAFDLISLTETETNDNNLGIKDKLKEIDRSTEEIIQLDDTTDIDEVEDNEVEDDEEELGFSTQTNAPRHLVRTSRKGKLPTDQNSKLKTGEYVTYNFNYYYDSIHKGKAVAVYILDTGIQAKHTDLEGRTRHGADFVNEGPGDFNGHGTHVAGIVGSKTFGVAKEVELIEVKCLDKKGQGDLTSVISSIEFAVEDMKKTGKPSVANLSLGAFRNTILNEAVRAAVDSGLVIVVAAGNSNTNACLNSPLSEESAITVGAMDDKTDAIAKFSNWGDCVDIFASGVKVESLSFMNEHEPLTFSGTSMAAPSVSGMVAILLDKGVAPEYIKEKLLQISTKNLLKRRSFLMRPRTPNRILFNGVVKQDDFFENQIQDYTEDKLDYQYENAGGDEREQQDLDEETLYKTNKSDISNVLHHDEPMEDMSDTNSNVPIKDNLFKRETVWYEPSFEELQSSID